MFAILGMVLGIGVVFFTNHLEGDPVSALIEAGAAVIVFGGTFAALMVHWEMSDIASAAKKLSWLMKPPNTDSVSFIKSVTEWADVRRKGGMLGLEATATEIADPFLRLGLTMAVDGKPFEELRDTMYQVGEVEDRENAVAGEVWQAAGGYGPTIGVLGAVLGLIHVMINLDKPSTLGVGIATAFVATVYGVGSANLVFFPLGARLKNIAGRRAVYREIVIDGILLLNAGTSPIMIREKLDNLLESRRRAGREDDKNSSGASLKTDQEASSQ